jgi:hypothetical protein
MSRISVSEYKNKYKDKIENRYMTNYINFCIGYSKKYDIKKGRDVTNKYIMNVLQNHIWIVCMI